MADHFLEVLSNILIWWPAGDERRQINSPDDSKKMANLRFKPVCNISGYDPAVSRQLIPTSGKRK